MPKTKLGDAFTPKDPPIDWLWAAVLERKMVKRLDIKRLAEMGGVSYPSMRNYMTKSPWDWPRNVRDSVCNELGIDPIFAALGLDKNDPVAAYARMPREGQG